MNKVETYNYPAYSFAMDASELARWLSEGPHTGEAAPDFGLEDLDGVPVQLSDLRGKPVVIEFGSYTCPIFSDRVIEMERLAQSHPEAEFLVIAVREAHPGEVTPHHQTLTQKRRAARCLAMEEGLRRRVLIDDLEGGVHRAYGGGWNPVYVIDAAGRVAFRRAWNHPGEVALALEALASGAALPVGESIDMVALPGRAPTGLRLLERGGCQALLDFYITAPRPFQRRLEDSASEAVRSVIAQNAVERVG
jgi:peroxiredoxin